MAADYLSNMGQDIGIVNMLESDYPGRTLAVIPLQRLPFRDFRAPIDGWTRSVDSGDLEKALAGVTGFDA
jgi:hypothetical protein